MLVLKVDNTNVFDVVCFGSRNKHYSFSLYFVERGVDEESGTC